MRSLHPLLGWICCISAVSGTLDGGLNTPRSWCAASADEEACLLQDFWSDVTGFPEDTVWTTFNGKRFDVPFLLMRGAHHGVSPTRKDLLSTYPYGHRPHADLACVWSPHCTLDGLFDLLSVTTPKAGMDGSRVAEMVQHGEVERVAAYCEADAVATFQCLQAVPWVLQL